MIKWIYIGLFSFLIFTPSISKSQFKKSIGIEGVTAFGDFGDVVSLGFGASLSAENCFTNKFGLELQGGYIYLLTEENYKSAYMIPLQAGFKFYFNYYDYGPYMKPIIGIHKTSITSESYSYSGITVPGITISHTDMSFGFGMGYVTEKKFDFYFRLNWITYGKSTGNYISIRIAKEFWN